MLPGFDGHLISEQFLEQQLAGINQEHAQRFVERMRRWREGQSHTGPTTAVRSLFEGGATPLAVALGFVGVDDERMVEGQRVSATVRRGSGAVSLLVGRYGEPLGPLWRLAMRDAVARSAQWSLIFNGTHLRLLYASRAISRRFAEFDLDAAADDDMVGRALWAVARADALCGDEVTADTATLIALSDRHGAQVCQSLRRGVLDASAHVVGALFERAKRTSIDEVFTQSLTLVYRLLFLFFAEARNLVPIWHPIYRDSYSLQRLCDLAEDPGARGLWDTVQALSRLAHAGCHAGDLRVTAYNGRLFAPSRAPLVELPHLAEHAARRTLVALSTRPALDGEGRERIAYRDLGVEQLGAVYETLLDYTPEVREAPRQQGLRRTRTIALRAGSSVRKSTGSFYTPESIVRFLVRRTLGPLVRDASPAEILSLRVVDPSMGSGAFLVGACRYLADAYVDALVATGGCHAAELGPSERAAIRRTVAERCLYGVDLNPMAVQLAQLSIWLATLSADRPLGFLDHHLVAGNSLVGVWLASLKRPPVRRTIGGELPLFGDDQLAPTLCAALPMRFSLTSDPSDTVEQVRLKERALSALTQPGTALARWKRVADLWTARWLASDLREVSSLFNALADWVLTGGSALPVQVARPLLERADALAAAHRVFHWELEFPEVFFTATGDRRVDAGFDAVIGNPPWKMLRDDGEGRGRDDGTAAHVVRFARDSGVYRVRGDGHANCYQLFLERSLALLRPGGRLGMVLPSGLAVDHGSASLRRLLFSSSRVESLVGFENRRAIFPIHRSVRFALLNAEVGVPTGTLQCRLGELDPEALEHACDDHGALHQAWWPVRLSPPLLERLSGPGLAIPDVRSTLDVAIAEGVAARFCALGSTSGWGVSFGRELNATEDRDAFEEVRALAEKRRTSKGCPTSVARVAVLEGKHIDPFVVRVNDARFSISAADAAARLGGRHCRSRLAYRDVASATNRQTLIAAILPPRVVSTHTLLCLKTALPQIAQWYFCGLFNSFVLNYLVRLRVTTHVTTSIVERLPVPTRGEAGPAFTSIATLARALSRGDAPDARAQLQGRVARLYGLNGEEFAHILRSFPLVDPAARQASYRAFMED